MPPRIRVTREMIIEAAVEVIRESGHETLTVRATARRLGCSTQPVLYQFSSVGELKEEAYQAADLIHTRFIMPEEGKDPLLSLGMNYIRFAKEEKNLFRFLFQSGRFEGSDLRKLTESPGTESLTAIVAQEARCTEAEAREAFLTLFIAVHGYASLLANNAMEYDEDMCAQMLQKLYLGLFGGEENVRVLP